MKRTRTWSTTQLSHPSYEKRGDGVGAVRKGEKTRSRPQPLADVGEGVRDEEDRPAARKLNRLWFGGSWVLVGAKDEFRGYVPYPDAFGFSAGVRDFFVGVSPAFATEHVVFRKVDLVWSVPGSLVDHGLPFVARITDSRLEVCRCRLLVSHEISLESGGGSEEHRVERVCWFVHLCSFGLPEATHQEREAPGRCTTSVPDRERAAQVITRLLSLVDVRLSEAPLLLVETDSERVEVDHTDDAQRIARLGVAVGEKGGFAVLKVTQYGDVSCRTRGVGCRRDDCQDERLCGVCQHGWVVRCHDGRGKRESYLCHFCYSCVSAPLVRGAKCQMDVRLVREVHGCLPAVAVGVRLKDELPVATGEAKRRGFRAHSVEVEEEFRLYVPYLDTENEPLVAVFATQKSVGTKSRLVFVEPAVCQGDLPGTVWTRSERGVQVRLERFPVAVLFEHGRETSGGDHHRDCPVDVCLYLCVVCSLCHLFATCQPVASHHALWRGVVGPVVRPLFVAGFAPGFRRGVDGRLRENNPDARPNGRRVEAGRSAFALPEADDAPALAQTETVFRVFVEPLWKRVRVQTRGLVAVDAGETKKAPTSGAENAGEQSASLCLVPDRGAVLSEGFNENVCCVVHVFVFLFGRLCQPRTDSGPSSIATPSLLPAGGCLLPPRVATPRCHPGSEPDAGAGRQDAPGGAAARGAARRRAGDPPQERGRRRRDGGGAAAHPAGGAAPPRDDEGARGATPDDGDPKSRPHPESDGRTTDASTENAATGGSRTGDEPRTGPRAKPQHRTERETGRAGARPNEAPDADARPGRTRRDGEERRPDGDDARTRSEPREERGERRGRGRRGGTRPTAERAGRTRRGRRAEAPRADEPERRRAPDDAPGRDGRKRRPRKETRRNQERTTQSGATTGREGDPTANPTTERPPTDRTQGATTGAKRNAGESATRRRGRDGNPARRAEGPPEPDAAHQRARPPATRQTRSGPGTTTPPRSRNGRTQRNPPPPGTDGRERNGRENPTTRAANRERDETNAASAAQAPPTGGEDGETDGASAATAATRPPESGPGTRTAETPAAGTGAEERTTKTEYPTETQHRAGGTAQKAKTQQKYQDAPDGKDAKGADREEAAEGDSHNQERGGRKKRDEGTSQEPPAAPTAARPTGGKRGARAKENPPPAGIYIDLKPVHVLFSHLFPGVDTVQGNTQWQKHKQVQIYEEKCSGRFSPPRRGRRTKRRLSVVLKYHHRCLSMTSPRPTEI